MPFTQDDLSYEDVPDLITLKYATGIFYEDDGFKYLEYGLYNNEEQKNIYDVYTRIFQTISENSIS